MMSAERRCSDNSKLVRVRVDGSTNRLTTVLPRRAGTFDGAFADGFERPGRVEHGGDFVRRQRFDVEQVFALPGHSSARMLPISAVSATNYFRSKITASCPVNSSIPRARAVG